MDKESEKLTRITVPELDQVLGKPFKVLDDGFVRVVDYMGTDASIVQSARVSYGAGTKTMNDDETLIRYLIRHKHTSPFEMCEIKFHLRVPMDCWRQWIRHRTANVNEYSTRYSIAIDSTSKTKEDQWRMQALRNRQGSAGFIDIKNGRELSKREAELHELLQNEYKRRIELGVAREQARKDLPLSTYTEAYWKIDLNNLLHFLELRMENKAQLEIRQYSETIGEEVVKRWCPMVWAAFKEYQFEPVKLSRTDEKIISLISKNDINGALKFAEEIGFIKKKEGGIKRNLECLELEDKLVRLGISIPWKTQD
ncbi:MAG: FAD-dependent thymidylate synthase [Elusimicrobia bacterium]|nr:FAD-dependent thymidylate synthase [Candidatus Liberimonas magnetica]